MIRRASRAALLVAAALLAPGALGPPAAGEAAGRGARGPVGDFVVAGAAVAGAPLGSEKPAGVASTLATRVRFEDVADAAALPDGDVLVADRGAHRVYRVLGSGRIEPFAGTGRSGSFGDRGDARRARLRAPTALAVTRGGAVLVADPRANAIRRVSAAGRISTVAGCGRRGLAGDGGRAVGACLDAPFDVAALPDGGMLIADIGNHRIRRVTAGGVITTVAGSVGGFAGDGGPATRARLDAPIGVAPLAGGAFAIADIDNDRVRIVDRDGTIRSLPRRLGAFFSEPIALAASPGGALLVADRNGGLLRYRTDGSAASAIGGVRDAPLLAWGLEPAGLARAPDGSILVADTAFDTVHLIATRRPSRLALRLTPRRVWPGATVRQRLVITQPATVSVTVRAFGEVLTAQRTRVRAGVSEIEVLRDAQPGEYLVDAVARSGGATTTATARLIVYDRRPPVAPTDGVPPRAPPR